MYIKIKIKQYTWDNPYPQNNTANQSRREINDNNLAKQTNEQ